MTKEPREEEMMSNKLKLWQVGLIVFILGGLVNAVLIRAGIGGLLRELMRLVILSGLGIFIFGLVKNFQKK